MLFFVYSQSFCQKQASLICRIALPFLSFFKWLPCLRHMYIYIHKYVYKCSIQPPTNYKAASRTSCVYLIYLITRRVIKPKTLVNTSPLLLLPHPSDDNIVDCCLGSSRNGLHGILIWQRRLPTKWLCELCMRQLGTSDNSEWSQPGPRVRLTTVTWDSRISRNHRVK